MSNPETPYQPTDRRPIASRALPVWQRTAAALAGAGVSANAISVAGMAVAVGGGASLAATPVAGRGAWALFLLAAAATQLRLLANMLDGMVALRAGKASAVGELYNELPDRVSDVALLVGAGYAVGGSVPLGYLAATVAVATAYVRAVGKSVGVAGLFHGPMAKPHRMAVLTAAAVLAAVVPPAWRVMTVAAAVVVGGGVVTCVRRVLLIAAHLRGRPR